MPIAALMPLVAPVSELAKSILDKIWPPQADPNQKLLAEMELTRMLQSRETAIIDATKGIIVSEMEQSDSYTKRARPTLVYAGLFFILLVHVASPMVSWFTKETLPAMSLPDEFWWAWSGVVGIWSLGRTFERRGAQNKVIDTITGK